MCISQALKGIVSECFSSAIVLMSHYGSERTTTKEEVQNVFEVSRSFSNSTYFLRMIPSLIIHTYLRVEPSHLSLRQLPIKQKVMLRIRELKINSN